MHLGANECGATGISSLGCSAGTGKRVGSGIIIADVDGNLIKIENALQRRLTGAVGAGRRQPAQRNAE